MLDSNALVSATGALLSLLMAYFPGVSTRFYTLSTRSKALSMIGLLGVTTGGVFASTCGGLVSVGVSCDQQGIFSLLQLFVIALVSNQSTFALFVRPFQPTKPEVVIQVSDPKATATEIAVLGAVIESTDVLGATNVTITQDRRSSQPSSVMRQQSARGKAIER